MRTSLFDGALLVFLILAALAVGEFVDLVSEPGQKASSQFSSDLLALNASSEHLLSAGLSLSLYGLVEQPVALAPQVVSLTVANDKRHEPGFDDIGQLGIANDLQLPNGFAYVSKAPGKLGKPTKIRRFLKIVRQATCVTYGHQRTT